MGRSPYTERVCVCKDTPARIARALFEGAYAGAPVVTFSPVGGSRHFVMLDQPERFAAVLKEFLARK